MIYPPLHFFSLPLILYFGHDLSGHSGFTCPNAKKNFIFFLNDIEWVWPLGACFVLWASSSNSNFLSVCPFGQVFTTPFSYDIDTQLILSVYQSLRVSVHFLSIATDSLSHI
jgi:hypothetical protein